MNRRYPILLAIFLSLSLAACAAIRDSNAPVQIGLVTGLGGQPGSCPVTQPPDPPYTPPPSYSSPEEGAFWYGSDALWTMLPLDGTWRGLPFSDNGYTQKTFWWQQGYDWQADPQPDLTVTGKRLDASAPPLLASGATNGYNPDLGSFMLVGVDIPTDGCWEITGQAGDQSLSFIVWVEP